MLKGEQRIEQELNGLYSREKNCSTARETKNAADLIIKITHGWVCTIQECVTADFQNRMCLLVK